MDVEVDQKRGKGRLQSIAHATLLGDGMLERARATTLGLLGVAGAVGLAMLALVFNQGWPLVAGGPVPPLPPREQAVARARAVSPIARSPGPADAGTRPHASGRDSGGPGQGPAAENASAHVPSSELVVVPATPAEPRGDAPPSGRQGRPAPAKPKATLAPPTQIAAQPPASPPSAAPSTPPSVPAPAPEPAPPATVSEAPESSVPSWSNGKGHAYGRSGREGED